MNRREFIGVAAAGTGLVFGAPALPGAEPVRRRIKAGFLGASHSHAADKWRLARTSGDYEVVGLSEDSPAVRARYEAQGARLMAVDDLLAASEVIFVESDVRDHARHGKLALGAGKHVHLEKPAADNLADVEEMIRLARHHQVRLQVGYMWRYHPGFHAIFKAVREGWLGDVYLVRGAIGNELAPDRRPEWAEFKGGGMFELGSHLIDATLRLMGEPLSVQSLLRRHGRVEDELRDNNVVVFEFPRATAVLHNSNLQPNAGRQRVFEVFGTRGSATLRPIEPPTLELDLARAAGPYKAGLQTVPMPKYDRYEGDLAELAAAVRGERPLSVTLDQELLVQRWLLKACEMS